MKIRRRAKKSPQTFWDHLAELRTRLIVCAVAVAVGAAVGLVLYSWLLDNFFLPPYCRVLESQGIDRQCNLVITEPLDSSSRIRVSLYVGLVLAMPALLWNLWRFVTPARGKSERRYALPFVVSGFCSSVAEQAGVPDLSAFRVSDFICGESVDPLFLVLIWA